MRNSFTNYFVYESNKNAYNLASNIAKSERVGNGLVLFCGDHATGKSHLLDSIWHEYLNFEDKHAEWMSCIGFKEIIDSVKLDIATAMSRLENVNLLLFDDIDLVDDTIDELFITGFFEKLIVDGKQICLTSYKKPSNIFGTEFRNLLSKGTCVEINPPNKLECIDFCKRYAKKQGVVIYGDDAYEYLAEKCLNFRNIKGSIHKLKSHLIVDNKETVALSKGAVRKYLESNWN